MSDLDVSLRLRLVNQLSRPAEEAERDLKELRDAAEKLGRTRGGEQLGHDIDQLGRKATDAKAKLGTVGAEAQQLREKLGRLNNTGGLDGLKADANQAKAALSNVGTEAQQLREKLGRLDNTGGLEGLKADANQAKTALSNVGTEAQQLREKLGRLNNTGGLEGLKQDADKAKLAIDSIGQAATEAKNKVDALGRSDPSRGFNRDPQRGTRPSNVVTPVPNARRRRGRDVVEGLADRSGVDAYLPIGAASAGYIAGGVVGAAAVGTGYAYKRFAGNDRELEYILMNMGVPEDQGDGVRKQVRDVAKDTRAPYSKVLEGFDALAATGANSEDALALLPEVSKTALASNSEPADVARTAFAITDKMKVAPADIGAALSALVAGGNLGQFEVPDMARYLPTTLAYASRAGFTGVEGLRKVIAMLQAVRADTGDSSVAATNLNNVFAKMRSEETEKNFADYGVDLPKEFKKGRSEGRDDMDILYEAAMKASKGGDPDIIARLFVDQQAFQGLQSIVRRRNKINSDVEEIGNSPDVVGDQYARVAHDPQSSLDALANAGDRATVALGSLADKLGLTREIDNLASGLERLVDDPAKFIWDNTIAGLQMPLKPRSGIEPEGDHREESLDAFLDNPLGTAPSKDAFRRGIGGADDNLPVMEGYAARVGQVLGSVGAAISGAVSEWKAMLDFTAGPTIQPTLLPPSSAPTGAAPQKQSARQPGGGTQIGSITQHISSPNSQMAARRSQREQDRAIRMAQWNAIGETGSVYG